MTEQGMSRTIETTEGSITYCLFRKSVKNMNLRIHADGSVRVSANKRVPVSVLDDFVRSRISFIRRAQRMYEQREQEHQLMYEDGDTVPFLNRQLILAVEKYPVNGRGRRARVMADFSRQQLQMTVPDDSTAQERRQLLQSWYKKQAEVILPGICERLYPLLSAYQIPYPQIKIRNMTSRWGSCQTRKGIVTLSTMLMEVPEQAVEYVIIHEFMHFLQPNHSAAFYQLVSEVLPDWKVRKAMLPRR